jgi:hypothetical protein
MFARQGEIPRNNVFEKGKDIFEEENPPIDSSMSVTEQRSLYFKREREKCQKFIVTVTPSLNKEKKDIYLAAKRIQKDNRILSMTLPDLKTFDNENGTQYHRDLSEAVDLVKNYIPDWNDVTNTVDDLFVRLDDIFNASKFWCRIVDNNGRYGRYHAQIKDVSRIFCNPETLIKAFGSLYSALTMVTYVSQIVNSVTGSMAKTPTIDKSQDSTAPLAEVKASLNNRLEGLLLQAKEFCRVTEEERLHALTLYTQATVSMRTESSAGQSPLETPDGGGWDGMNIHPTLQAVSKVIDQNAIKSAYEIYVPGLIDPAKPCLRPLFNMEQRVKDADIAQISSQAKFHTGGNLVKRNNPELFVRLANQSNHFPFHHVNNHNNFDPENVSDWCSESLNELRARGEFSDKEISEYDNAVKSLLHVCSITQPNVWLERYAKNPAERLKTDPSMPAGLFEGVNLSQNPTTAYIQANLIVHDVERLIFENFKAWPDGPTIAERYKEYLRRKRVTLVDAISNRYKWIAMLQYLRDSNAETKLDICIDLIKNQKYFNPQKPVNPKEWPILLERAQNAREALQMFQNYPNTARTPERPIMEDMLEALARDKQRLMELRSGLSPDELSKDLELAQKLGKDVDFPEEDPLPLVPDANGAELAPKLGEDVDLSGKTPRTPVPDVNDALSKFDVGIRATVRQGDQKRELNPKFTPYWRRAYDCIDMVNKTIKSLERLLDIKLYDSNTFDKLKKEMDERNGVNPPADVSPAQAPVTSEPASIDEGSTNEDEGELSEDELIDALTHTAHIPMDLGKTMKHPSLYEEN